MKSFIYLYALICAISIMSCKKADEPNSPTQPPDQIIITLYAGSTQGNIDGDLSEALFHTPYGLAFDMDSNLYITDYGNHNIRKITPDGIVSTFAGSGSVGSADGNGTNASFNNPRGIGFDSQGNLYVVDTGNNLIRKITPTGDVTTFAGGGSGVDSFNMPSGIVFDGNDNAYVSDQYNNQIKKITPAGTVTIFAGSGAYGNIDGTGTAAEFNAPGLLAIDESDNIYVSDAINSMVRKISPAGVVTTVAQLNVAPRGIDLDSQGNLYIAAASGEGIIKITPAGIVSTLTPSISVSFDLIMVDDKTLLVCEYPVVKKVAFP